VFVIVEREREISQELFTCEGQDYLQMSYHRDEQLIPVR